MALKVPVDVTISNTQRNPQPPECLWFFVKRSDACNKASKIRSFRAVQLLSVVRWRWRLEANPSLGRHNDGGGYVALRSQPPNINYFPKAWFSLRYPFWIWWRKARAHHQVVLPSSVIPAHEATRWPAQPIRVVDTMEDVLSRPARQLQFRVHDCLGWLTDNCWWFERLILTI
jgi:hypothetical protein